MLLARDFEGRLFSVLGYGTMRDGSHYVTLRPLEVGAPADDEHIFTLTLAQLSRDLTLRAEELSLEVQANK